MDEDEKEFRIKFETAVDWGFGLFCAVYAFSSQMLELFDDCPQWSTYDRAHLILSAYMVLWLCLASAALSAVPLNVEGEHGSLQVSLVL